MASSSVKYLNKYKRSTDNQKPEKRNKDEFFLPKKDVELFNTFLAKVKKLYNVDITFDEDTKTDDGQWIYILGEHVDRRNAKVFISPSSRFERFSSD